MRVNCSLSIFWSISLFIFTREGTFNPNLRNAVFFGLEAKVFLCKGLPELLKMLLTRELGPFTKREELGSSLPLVWEFSGRRRSLSLSFVWPLPSRCERVGLGASGCGNNYPEHS